MARRTKPVDDVWTLFQIRTVRQIAKLLDVDRRTVQRWKTNRNPYKAITMTRLTDFAIPPGKPKNILTRSGTVRRRSYKRVNSFHEETGERVVMVRGRVSKKYNSPDVWLRLTREHRNAVEKAWRRKNRTRYLAQQSRRNGKHRIERQRWEKQNEKRRKSPRRKLFAKLRRLGVAINEARRVSGWFTTHSYRG